MERTIPTPLTVRVPSRVSFRHLLEDAPIMSSSPLPGFVISASFVDNRVVLAVRGEIDLVTAGE